MTFYEILMAFYEILMALEFQKAVALAFRKLANIFQKLQLSESDSID